MLLALLLAATTLAAPQEAHGPSFDCTAAFQPVETAICSDGRLALLDLRLAERYAAVRGAIGPQARAALVDDQRWFLGARDEWFENREGVGFRDFPDLADRMSARIDFLESVRTEPAAELVGVWSNLAGEVLVMPAGEGRARVEITAAQPVNARWICEVAGSGRISDGVLIVAPEGAADWRLEVRLRRGFVEVTEIGPQDNASRPWCGHNGHVDGVYFRRR
jgi:uncharacterized protein YecT (DUF1311 family)